MHSLGAWVVLGSLKGFVVEMEFFWAVMRAGFWLL